MGGRACRGVRMVITLAAAPAAGQSVQPGPPAVFSWGWNQGGEVGNGTTTPQATPGPVLGLPTVHGLQVTVKQVAYGSLSYAGAALLADGTMYTWGRNNTGELGDGTTTQRLTAAIVPRLSGITQIAEGGGFMLAAGTGGAVWAWGLNDNGELGDGTTTNRTSPVPVPGLTGITQLSVSPAHVLALRSDGTVWSWGDNNAGQLGNGTTTSRSTPGLVPGLTGITQVAAGDGLSYALRSDGTLFVWGSGVLGVGSTKAYTPVAVPLAGVTQVSTSGDDTLAIVGPSHTVYAWGMNFGGRSATERSTSSRTPRCS
jgi:hypothetical protein